MKSELFLNLTRHGKKCSRITNCKQVFEFRLCSLSTTRTIWARYGSRILLRVRTTMPIILEGLYEVILIESKYMELKEDWYLVRNQGE